jgi:hypothetical protein
MTSITKNNDQVARNLGGFMRPHTEKFENYLIRKNAIYRKMLSDDQMEDMLKQQALILKKIADAEDESDRSSKVSSVKGDH